MTTIADLIVRALADAGVHTLFGVPGGGSVVPDGHRWFGGVFTNAVVEQALIAESDLLIGVGLDPVELLPRAWTPTPPIVYCGPWPVDDGHVPFAAQLVTAVWRQHGRKTGRRARPGDRV